MVNNCDEVNVGDSFMERCDCEDGCNIVWRSVVKSIQDDKKSCIIDMYDRTHEDVFVASYMASYKYVAKQLNKRDAGDILW